MAKKIMEFGPMKYLNIGLDVAGVSADLEILLDDSHSFEERFFAFTDAVSRGIGYLGPAGMLGSAAIDIWTEAAQLAMEMDWSREGTEQAIDYLLGNDMSQPGIDLSDQGIKDTVDYAIDNPGVVVDEFIKAVPQVPGVIGRVIGAPWW